MTTLLNSQRGVKAHEYCRKLDSMTVKECVESGHLVPLRMPTDRPTRGQLLLWLSALLVSFSFFAWCCYSQGALQLYRQLFHPLIP